MRFSELTAAYMVTRSPPPPAPHPPNGLGSPFLFCGVGCGGVDLWVGRDSLLFCDVWSGGWESCPGVEFVLGSVGGLVVVVKLL